MYRGPRQVVRTTHNAPNHPTVDLGPFRDPAKLADNRAPPQAVRLAPNAPGVAIGPKGRNPTPDRYTKRKRAGRNSARVGIHDLLDLGPGQFNKNTSRRLAPPLGGNTCGILNLMYICINPYRIHLILCMPGFTLHSRASVHYIHTIRVHVGPPNICVHACPCTWDLSCIS